MSFKEVKELRQSGKLEEALAMAQEDLEADPKDSWNKRSISWVYYDYLKKDENSVDYQSFKKHLIAIRDLDFDEEDRMIFDASAWQIGKLIFALIREGQMEEYKILELVKITKDFHFTKPSESYSFIFKAFHKTLKDILNPLVYLDFADWWDFDNFRAEDFTEDKLDNGKKIMSIAEQAYIAYSKKLLEVNPLPKTKIEDFLPALDYIIENYPDYKYTTYYKAKLLIALGDDDDVLSAFLPFAKQKRNDFWVWELMANIFKDDNEKQLACYAKGASLNTPEDFLVKFRQNFAEVLVENEFYDEAKTELKIAVTTRRENEWKIPNEIKKLAHVEWFENAQEKESNKGFYQKYIPLAEEILYRDIPEEVVVVEYVNRNKKILNFIKNKEKTGFFKYSEHLKQPEIGDVLKVRLKAVGNDGFFHVLSLKAADKGTEIEAVKDIEGSFKEIPNKNFGFIDDVFVSPQLVQKEGLEDGQKITGKAMLSYDKSKEKWGWKVFEISKSK